MIKANRLNLKPTAAVCCVILALTCNLQSDDGLVHLTLRSRAKARAAAGGGYGVVERKVAWDPKKTVIIICDMWDDHWCKSAARRVAELAGPMNDVVKAARARGVFIIHAPSSVVNFYKGTPQRQRALSAAFAKAPAPLSTSE